MGVLQDSCSAWTRSSGNWTGANPANPNSPRHAKNRTWSRSFLASPPVMRAPPPLAHPWGSSYATTTPNLPTTATWRTPSALPTPTSPTKPSMACGKSQAVVGLRHERPRRGWWQAAWPGNSWRRSASRSGLTWSACKTSACPCPRRFTAETKSTPILSDAPTPTQRTAWPSASRTCAGQATPWEAPWCS